jgi:uncharacterized membrane protein required for colicin V production
LTELLNLIGAISVTALCVNYVSVVAEWVRPWLAWIQPTLLTFIVFVILFLGLLFLVHRLLRLLSEFVKWERLYWVFEMLGLLLGCLRGLWWATLILLMFVSSGVDYLRLSVEERSVIGPRLLPKSREIFERVVDCYPGSQNQGKTLVPPMRAGADS